MRYLQSLIFDLHRGDYSNVSNQTEVQKGLQYFYAFYNFYEETMATSPID